VTTLGFQRSDCCGNRGCPQIFGVVHVAPIE
jgi:hypothetical protein